jgi:transposase
MFVVLGGSSLVMLDRGLGRLARQHWTRAHRAWLARQSFSHPAEHIVYEELIQRMEVACARQTRYEDALRRLRPAWSLAGVVNAIQAMRGVACCLP